MLSIGNLTLNSPLVLAPMSGISDLAYRLINRSFGCELAFTEMIGTESLAHNSRNTLKMLLSREEDRPLGVQILGCDQLPFFFGNRHNDCCPKIGGKRHLIHER